MPRVLRSTCLLAVIGVALLLGACADLPSRTSAQATGPYTLLVVRRAWHVDVGWSAGELKSPLNTVAAQFPGLRYLLFGFGDRHYLLDHDHGSGGMLAALWPGGGLLLVTGLSNTPQQAFGADEVLEIGVSEQQLRDAQQFVWRSLADEDGTVKPLQVGPYDGSFFYATPLKYSAAHTCNTWAAEVLRAAHLPVRSRGVVFAGQLWRQAQVLARRASAQPSGVLAPSDSALPSR
ncbi:MAG TPA: DUF2459 domain-containing protein [Steroidobacteraceae bacterium]|jgi:hypothetical protein